MEETIKNYDSYTSGMKKSSADKLFWMSKIEKINTVVDFGCADGTLIREMNSEMPDLQYIGYDNSKAMISLAGIRTPHELENIQYVSDLKESLKENNQNKTLLNLSSVIHEVYSYSNINGIDKFWNNVFGYDYGYIAIRDFCVSRSVNRQSDINDYTKVIRGADELQIMDYESIWGSLRDNRNLIHYLMKYRYKENWDREVRENYFPITLEQLLSKIPTYKYEIIYFEDYILPFTSSKIKQDFDVDIHDNTHVKLLLRLKEGVNN